MDVTIDKQTMTYREAAQYLGIGLSTLKRYVAVGTVRHVPIGGRTVFRRVDLDAFLEANARGGVRRRSR
jgi:excisionase family DNA binding protein